MARLGLSAMMTKRHKLLLVIIALLWLATATSLLCPDKRIVTGQRHRPASDTQFSIDYLLDIEMSDDEMPYIMLLDME